MGAPRDSVRKKGASHKERWQNIGIISTAYGSGASLLSNFVRLLSYLAEDVHVISPNAALEGCNEARFHTINYKRESRKNILIKTTRYFGFQVGVSHKMVKLGRRVDFWVVHLGGGLLLPMLTAKLLGKKVMLALGGYLEKEVKVRKEAPLPKLQILFNKISCRLADRIILYSERLISLWGLERYRNKIAVAPRHFVDFNNFKTEVELNKRNNTVGYIGDLSEIKGVLNLLRAIEEESMRGTKITFLIGGDGNLRSQVEEYLQRKGVKDKINYVGWIAHKDVPRYLNELKLLVLPSYSEGLPNIVLEAMACGTPVLATSVGAIPDIVKDGSTGFILDDNSPETIARGIIRALNHPALDKIAQNARCVVEREYTLEVAAKKYREMLRNAI